MYKIKLSDLDKLYKAISEDYPLYLPIKKAGEVNYGLYGEDEEVSLTTLKTVKSPKDAFFPQSEDLVNFKVDGNKIEVIDIRKEEQPFVVMGVRACDFKAFDVLDRVFLVDPLDTFYQNKRNAAIVVTNACTEPEDSCFCKVFGIDASEPSGDITTFIIGENLFWRANTEKGNALTEKVKELFTETDDKIVAEEQKAIREKINSLPNVNLDLTPFKDEMLDIFNSEKWGKLSEACLGCGACTFVCPTCQCFDIRELTKNDGTVSRFRCWDSCMYSDFTKTAGGQPRTTQMQRYRQRFMHKLVYYPENNEGVYSCVGCGRCVKSCPMHLNIVKVIKAFDKGGKDE